MAQGRKGTGKARNSFIEVPCVIAVDQSYTRSGIAICVNGKVVKATSIPMHKYKSKSLKRTQMRNTLSRAINSALRHFNPDQVVILVERIRTFTGTGERVYHAPDISGNLQGLRPAVIKAHAALIATIVDTGFEYGIKTFSVTTKSWKSAVLGSSKPVFEPVEGVSNPQKFGSVQKAIDLGFFEQMKVVSAKKRNAYTLDDDMADAICMSLYPFSGQPYHLELED